jgi:hypothetical protein
MPGLVPGIHVLWILPQAWMDGTSLAMTMWKLSAHYTGNR